MCHTYHAGFGYDQDEALLEEPNPLSMWENEVDWIERVEPEVSDEDEEGCLEVVYHLDCKKAKTCSKDSKISHSKVSIRLAEKGETGWTQKPDNVVGTCFDEKKVVSDPVPWYELPVRAAKYKCTFEEPISTRNYINVTDPYDEVVISKQMKGDNITIDDILFASRALCCGPDRSVSQYYILSDHKGELTLLADIDNWST